MLYKDVTKELCGAKSMLVMHNQCLSMLKALFFFLISGKAWSSEYYSGQQFRGYEVYHARPKEVAVSYFSFFRANLR